MANLGDVFLASMGKGLETDRTLDRFQIHNPLLRAVLHPLTLAGLAAGGVGLGMAMSKAGGREAAEAVSRKLLMQGDDFFGEPMYHSRLAEALARAPQNRRVSSLADLEKVVAKGGGASRAESAMLAQQLSKPQPLIAHGGLRDIANVDPFVDQPMTVAELLEAMRDNPPFALHERSTWNPHQTQVQPSYQRYTVPGGDEYGELAFYLRNATQGNTELARLLSSSSSVGFPTHMGHLAPDRNAEPLGFVLHKSRKMRDIADPLMSIEQLQSDWPSWALEAEQLADPVVAQEFKRRYPDFMMARMLREAAERGQAGVMWHPGDDVRAFTGGRQSGQAAWYGALDPHSHQVSEGGRLYDAARKLQKQVPGLELRRGQLDPSDIPEEHWPYGFHGPDDPPDLDAGSKARAYFQGIEQSLGPEGLARYNTGRDAWTRLADLADVADNNWGDDVHLDAVDEFLAPARAIEARVLSELGGREVSASVARVPYHKIIDPDMPGGVPQGLAEDLDKVRRFRAAHFAHDDQLGVSAIDVAQWIREAVHDKNSPLAKLGGPYIDLLERQLPGAQKASLAAHADAIISLNDTDPSGYFARHWATHSVGDDDIPLRLIFTTDRDNAGINRAVAGALEELASDTVNSLDYDLLATSEKRAIADKLKRVAQDLRLNPSRGYREDVIGKFLSDTFYSGNLKAATARNILSEAGDFGSETAYDVAHSDLAAEALEKLLAIKMQDRVRRAAASIRELDSFADSALEQVRQRVDSGELRDLAARLFDQYRAAGIDPAPDELGEEQLQTMSRWALLMSPEAREKIKKMTFPLLGAGGLSVPLTLQGQQQ